MQACSREVVYCIVGLKIPELESQAWNLYVDDISCMI